MAAITITDEFSSSIAAPRIFKALILDGHILIPKLFPHAIESIELIQGDGGPGTIKKLNYAGGVELQHLKQRVDVLDKEKLTYKYTMIEGADLTAGKLESVTYEMQFESSPEGGCKGKSISTYYPAPGVVLNEEEIEAGKEKAKAVFKAVEAYLSANPEAYA